MKENIRTVRTVDSLSHTDGQEMSEWKSICEESMSFYVLTGPLCGFMMMH